MKGTPISFSFCATLMLLSTVAFAEGKDMRAVYMYGADLRNSDLKGADLAKANLQHADLRGHHQMGLSGRLGVVGIGACLQ